jgi:hypothetical protein
MYRHASVTVALSKAVSTILREYEPTLDVETIPDAVSNLEYDEGRVRAFREQFAGKFLIGHVAALDDRYKGQFSQPVGPRP